MTFPPPERRKEYTGLEERLDTHAEVLEKRLSRFIIKALLAFAAIGLLTAVALFGFGLVLDKQSSTADRLTAVVEANRQTAIEIQNQRKDSIRSACELTNKRHNDTTKALIIGAGADINSRKTEAGKKEVRRRRDVTLGLINALVPKQNCDALVERSVKK